MARIGWRRRSRRSSPARTQMLRSSSRPKACAPARIGCRRSDSEVMSPLQMAAAAAARVSSVSSCTSEIDAKLADAFSFRMDVSLEAGAKRSGEGVAMPTNEGARRRFEPNSWHARLTQDRPIAGRGAYPMSSRANPASTPQKLAFRARRNWSIGKSGQPGSDDHAIGPIPAANSPTSYSATDATTSASEVWSRSAYYSVIARAVARLPKNTRDACFALYDRAEVELAAELLQDPIKYRTSRRQLNDLRRWGASGPQPSA